MSSRRGSPGAHSNVGGGYAETGLSDAALIWMIARIEALTKLEFDAVAVRAMTKGVNVDGEVVDFEQGLADRRVRAA